MRHKVLIAEKSDAIRGVAEATLRQNGYEVIAIEDADKALEVLELARPHLLIVGADLTTEDRVPLYDKVHQNPQTANLPVLLFQSEDGQDHGFPDEVVIARPVDTHDLMTKVSIFIGQGDGPVAREPVPGQIANLDDDLLDAALGIDGHDQINVTDSEIMDQTSVTQVAPKGPTGENLVHIEEELDDSTKVESVTILEGSGPIKQKAPQPAEPMRGSGKLEIADDQYDVERLSGESAGGADGHDYDWFVNSMQSESAQQSGEPTGARPADSSKLSIVEPAASVDPQTPGPSSPATPALAKTTASKSAGVDQFIDEFKKEIEQLRVDRPEEFDSSPQAEAGPETTAMAWDEKVEKLTDQDAQLFTRELARELGRSIAELVVARIDPEKLLELVKKELVQRYNKK